MRSIRLRWWTLAGWTFISTLSAACGPGAGSPRLEGEDSADSGGADSGEGALPEQLSVLSLNLHCLKLDGTPYADNAERFAAIARLVAEEEVAVLAAAEICADGETDAEEALRLALEAATGEGWTSSAVFAHTAWEGTADEAEERVGLFVQGEPAASGALTFAVQGSLNRVAAYATLPASRGGLTVWSVHLEVFEESVRLQQAREAAGAALALADPGLDVLVAGDMNDVEGSATHAAYGAAGFTDLSQGLDPERIDHVFAHRGAAWALDEARLVFDGDAEPAVSDHPGVLVRLVPAEGEAVDWTRVTASADAGFGHYLALRGDVDPLSWDAGWPGAALDDQTWRWVSTEIPAGEPFAYKTLLDDEQWQTGEDSAGVGGEDQEIRPTY